MITINIEKKMRTYQGNTVLKVDSWIPMQSVTKIAGPSGSGKTTLLKVIAGLSQPETGRIGFDGKLWLDTKQKFYMPTQQREIGFVFQDYALFPNMSVLQHLQYATTDSEWIDRLLRFGKLETLTSHKPQYLSGGQQQRLAILRALATKPRLLLMDEPFSALDHEMRAELIGNLGVIIKELNATCFIVSHNPYEVDPIATNTLRIGQ